MQPFKKDNLWILCQDQLKPTIDGNWFDQEFWNKQGRLLGTASSGRGAAWMIKSEFGKWVLRHYYRGGMPAKVNNDKYLWTGLLNTRAVKEFKLLKHIQKIGLPSPKPVAVQVKVSGLFYRNDLIMEYIEHQQTFAGFLKHNKQESNDQFVWTGIGAMIKKYHNHGIYHDDLNTHNILIAKQGVHLIDFDKGKIKTPRASWRQANLDRLKRSIEKETGKRCDQELQPHWQQLLDAYHGS